MAQAAGISSETDSKIFLLQAVEYAVDMNNNVKL